MKFAIFAYLYLSSTLAQNAEPTRPIDLWHPFGTTTTRSPQQKLSSSEVIVRLPVGDVVGKKVIIADLPWNPAQDPADEDEQLNPDDPRRVPKRNNVTVFTFLGIPYAEPPVGQRRLKPPQQLQHLPGQNPYLAFQNGAACPQDVETRPTLGVNDLYPFLVDEDCLYLNVFTPDAAGSSYPVLVFLHGGNFQTGSANEWPAHGLASRGVVVVTVNYRLGALGFMSLGDSSSGNYGFQDQRLALEWVRDHIASFGGDPQAVTLVGHDAGGVSTGLHMQSPYSKNLFRSAASLSGSEVSYHSTIAKPVLAFNNTIKLGRYLGCAQTLPSEVWDCIQTRSSNDIVRATTDIPIEFNRYLFLPTVDGRNIPFNPLWMLNNVPGGSVNYPSPVPFLVGMNAQDGSEVVLEDRYLGEFNGFNNVDYQYMKSFVLEYAFRHNYTMNREAIVDAIVDRYTYWPDPADDFNLRRNFVELATDAYYTSPISLSAHLHSAAGSRTFMFVNNYNFSRPTSEPQFLPDYMGVCRECDLYLLFGYPFLKKELLPNHLRNITFTDQDRNASCVLSSILRRFAYTQNPNFLHDGSWSALEPRRHWYMDFNYTRGDSLSSPGVRRRDYKYQDVAFWNEYLPSLVNYMTTTFSPFEVAIRRELTAYKWIVGIVVSLMMIFIVLAGSFGYQLCNVRSESPKEDHPLMPSSYNDHFSSSTSFGQPSYVV